MPFTGIDPTSIIGTASTGVQGMLPRFTLDADSKPTLDQAKAMADKAINMVTRTIRFKGYDPNSISDPALNANAEEDLLFIRTWIELATLAEIITTQDQFKDSKAYNARLDQLQSINKQFDAAQDPFIAVSRTAISESYKEKPTHIVRRRLRPAMGADDCYIGEDIWRDGGRYR